VFRPTQGGWYVHYSAGGTDAAVGYGANGDVPVAADYDGDGEADIAVFRPSDGVWYVQGGTATAWGANGDIPVPADYDGDGRADIAVFRPAQGVWYVHGGATVAWGTRGDLPVMGLPTSGRSGGGPIVLLEVDAEDNAPSGHGMPMGDDVRIVQNMLSSVTNGGSGVLVVGGGKPYDPVDGPDSVTTFWNSIHDAVPSMSVTFVNGGSAIAAQSLSGFALVAVVSDEIEVWGGLTQEEYSALDGRAADLGTFISGGGGLLGFLSAGADDALLLRSVDDRPGVPGERRLSTRSSGSALASFSYLNAIGQFPTALGYYDYGEIVPTQGGIDLGISDPGWCCWHGNFTAYPSSFSILAATRTGQPVAIGYHIFPSG